MSKTARKHRPATSYYDEVLTYAESIVNGQKVANKETIQMCKRFLNDLKNPEYELRTRDPDFAIGIIEKTFVHNKGQSLDGKPLKGTPFLLQPWQKFIVYNLLGFYHTGTIIRRFKEAFIFVPRKNGKTSFIAALSWAFSLLERKSGSTLYIIGAALRQAQQSFSFLLYNLRRMGEAENFRILDNNQESSISRDFGGNDGSIYIGALAANPEKQDSLNCNIAIADEIHAYKSANQYNVIKEAMIAYTNKLMVGITTAGNNQNSFGYNRLVYCQKILAGTVRDEKYFVFIAKADETDDGDVDYLNPIEHEKANPNYGVSINPDEILQAAYQAQNDPQDRPDFFAKRLNKYTSAVNAYFNVDRFRASNEAVETLLGLNGKSRIDKLKALSKLPIKWYGGADLSKLHDLTATAIYGNYKNVDIVIPHAFFPVEAAHLKAQEDNIPLFGWKDDGWLTMTNTPTVDQQEVIRWFMNMRAMGFNISQIGFDKKFGREFFLGMKAQKFNVVDAPQYFHLKSEGFRRIEVKSLNKEFYYLGAEPFEYCVQNVRGIEQTDDAIKYEKIQDELRIDVFDASVFAAMQMLESLEKSTKAGAWLNTTKKNR